MTRRLLFILRYREPRDDLKFIARIAQNNAHIKESDNVKIKVLLLSSSYLFDDPWPLPREQVKLEPDLQKIIDSGGEVVFSIHSDYPKWHVTYDPELHSSYEWEYKQAKWFKESVIKLVDPYEYVANAVNFGFEVIKW